MKILQVAFLLLFNYLDSLPNPNDNPSIPWQSAHNNKQITYTVNQHSLPSQYTIHKSCSVTIEHPASLAASSYGSAEISSYSESLLCSLS